MWRSCWTFIARGESALSYDRPGQGLSNGSGYQWVRCYYGSDCRTIETKFEIFPLLIRICPKSQWDIFSMGWEFTSSSFISFWSRSKDYKSCLFLKPDSHRPAMAQPILSPRRPTARWNEHWSDSKFSTSKAVVPR
jgi:hypothetical protein